jgi:hypothetical protein
VLGQINYFGTGRTSGFSPLGALSTYWVITAPVTNKPAPCQATADASVAMSVSSIMNWTTMQTATRSGRASQTMSDYSPYSPTYAPPYKTASQTATFGRRRCTFGAIVQSVRFLFQTSPRSGKALVLLHLPLEIQVDHKRKPIHLYIHHNYNQYLS